MKPKRITAFLLSVAMILSLMPTFSLTALADETQAATTEKNITLGTKIIKKPSKNLHGNYSGKQYYYSPNSYIYFGMDDETPIKWRVLDSDKANDKTTDGIFMLSEYALGKGTLFNSNQSDGNNYQSSNVHKWCSDFASNTGNFSDAEQTVMFGVEKTDNAETLYSLAWEQTELKQTDKLFCLSVREVFDYLSTLDRTMVYERQATTVTNELVLYWLRNPRTGKSDRAAAVHANGLVDSYPVYSVLYVSPAVRPGCNLDKSKILFTSSPTGKNTDNIGTVAKNDEYAGNDYKLTIKDDSRTFSVIEQTLKSYANATVQLNYLNAEMGDGEYISAMITDKDENEVLYYGQLQKAESVSGTIMVTLPSDIAKGEYTLKLFNEKINSDYKTDVSSAFSDIDLTIGFKETGTETDPYLIHNLSDLEYFRDMVNAQEITSHSAILTADITIDNSVVWTPIALADHCESTFDGKGHTITFANTKEGSTFGLFANYNYSTISNLYLKGSITCNQSDLMGALVNSGYRTTIKNVISTVSITNSGNAGTGGLFGRLGGKDEKAMIKNCAVYADIQSAGRAGGLIGENWGGTQHCFVQNSAYMGDVSGSTAGAIMGYNGLQSGCRSRFTDVYYCEKDGLEVCGGTYGGTITATRVESKTAEQFRSGEVAYLLNNGVTDKTQVWYQTCNTDSYPKFKGDTVYRGYVCGTGSSNPIYANSMDGLIINPTSEHSYDETGFCVNCKTTKPADLDKTENVYKIYSLGELQWFADKVNGGETAVNGKLMNDIDTTSLSYLGIGKDVSHAFAGTFDGNNKTLKIALVSTEQYVAPFLYVNGATIKNLTVSGTIKTTHKFAAGIVGRIESGNSTLENCLSLVEIDSTDYTGGDGTHGGLIAVSDGGTTTVNNCGFAGSIIGKTTTSCGGIVGWAGSTVKISNSFVAAKFELQSNSGDTFAINQGKVTVTNCYYLNALSDAMYSGATQATADKFASGEVAYHLQGTQEIQIWGQKIGTDTLPTFSEAKVYEDTYNNEKIYRNEINENKIFSLGEDKKSAIILLDKAGTYTIVFADYEGENLANIKTFEVTVDKAQAVRVTSDKDFTLGTGDKIMLWNNLKNLTPMCEAYEVK